MTNFVNELFTEEELKQFDKLMKEIKEAGLSQEETYEISPSNQIVELAMRFYNHAIMEYQILIDLNENTKISSVYVENSNSGEYVRIYFKTLDIALFNLEHKGNIKFQEITPMALNTQFVGHRVYNNQETITQSIARIEQNIYTLPYDDLDDYLKGIRDFMNLLNGEESNKDIADGVIEQLRNLKS